MIGGGAPAGASSGAGAAAASAPYASGCPVVGANPANQMPPSANEPLPGQSKPLSTWRQHSNIPTGASADALPQHQQTSGSGRGSSGSGDEVSQRSQRCTLLQDGPSLRC